jgi:hypothetical protein
MTGTRSPVRAVAELRDDGVRAIADAVGTVETFLSRLCPSPLDDWLRAGSDDRTVLHSGVRLRVDHPGVDDERRARLVRDEYEAPTARLVERHLAGRAVDVVELGGGVGYVPCRVDRLLAPGRTHVVVEADEQRLPVLGETRTTNEAQFITRHAAYAPDGDHVRFSRTDGFVRDDGQTESGSLDVEYVEAVSLRTLLVDYCLDPVAVVANAGGVVHELVEGETDLLRTHVDLLVVNVDAAGEEGNGLTDRLATLGFEPVDRDGDVHAFENRSR